MPNVRQACATLMLRRATASTAISFLWDGLATFFQALPSTNRSACSSRHTYASGGGFIRRENDPPDRFLFLLKPPTPSSRKSSTHPYPRTSTAICKNSRCLSVIVPITCRPMASFHARDKAQIPAHHFRPASISPLSSIVPIACWAAHNLRVAILLLFHPKSPQSVCQENSTSEHHFFRGDYQRGSSL